MPELQFKSLKEIDSKINIPWDNNISLNVWCSTAEKLYHSVKIIDPIFQALSFEKQQNFEEAYMKYMTFCILFLEYFPKHKDYINFRQKPKYKEISLLADETLKILAEMKPLLKRLYVEAENKKALQPEIHLLNQDIQKIEKETRTSFNHGSFSNLSNKIFSMDILISVDDYIEPTLLKSIVSQNKYEILFIDLRENHTWPDGGTYFPSGNVLVINPHILKYATNITDIEKDIPAQFKTLTQNRDKFDLIIYYDLDSSFQKEIHRKLIDIFYTFEFSKALKKKPVLLKGGIVSYHAVNPNGFVAHLPNPTFDILIESTKALNLNTSDTGQLPPHPPKMLFDNPFSNFQPNQSQNPQPLDIPTTFMPSNMINIQYPRISAFYEPVNPAPLPSNVTAPRIQNHYLHNLKSEIKIDKPVLPPKPNRDVKIANNNSAPPIPPRISAPSKLPEELITSPIDLFAEFKNGYNLNFSNVHSKAGLCGLKNLGNTCFMNSSLQCLSSTLPLTRYFLNGSFKKHINKSNPMGYKGNVAEAYNDVLKALWSGDNSYVTPTTFKTVIGKYANRFEGNDQQDSQEFLSFLLDGIHEDLNIVTNKPITSEINEDLYNDEQLSNISWKNYLLKNQSVIVSLLQGQYRSKLTCQVCGKMTSSTFNPFMFLSLPIPNSRGVVPLEYCIQSFLKEEVLDGDNGWNCTQCKTKRKTTKKLDLFKLPTVLMIHLKRFSFDGPFRDKLETAIIFPLQQLDLSAFVESKDNSKSYIYDLFAVSNHFGGLNGGHYTAFCYNGYQKQWFNFDDSRVTAISETEIKVTYIS
ncbi:cysteine proteinase [Rozella allomycis CSF55]|uniref:Ubiquitin carboxyl-terminal hydrolase n=1 Tax=Rozella allomycis (strain CSF55) TaxID=988480 RepID=A0A075AW36_ROZAC|nr:Peptidase C19, ubiquitin carboxyl-terminal hydrolase 2 domain-containing protein [Rozella allomycis CSF55]RKP20554.1 cysteine proteinase [Rozella allomycis CSF55]|eukprot:EPZ34470.1 Peptidase C19, ubiquitin carboxyl-terminal hydrolase 2 domain-containing protein [Rozella allomycis CSF55]